MMRSQLMHFWFGLVAYLAWSSFVQAHRLVPDAHRGQFGRLSDRLFLSGRYFSRRSITRSKAITEVSSDMESRPQLRGAHGLDRSDASSAVSKIQKEDRVPHEALKAGTEMNSLFYGKYQWLRDHHEREWEKQIKEEKAYAKAKTLRKRWASESEEYSPRHQHAIDDSMEWSSKTKRDSWQSTHTTDESIEWSLKTKKDSWQSRDYSKEYYSEPSWEESEESEWELSQGTESESGIELTKFSCTDFDTPPYRCTCPEGLTLVSGSVVCGPSDFAKELFAYDSHTWEAACASAENAGYLTAPTNIVVICTDDASFIEDVYPQRWTGHIGARTTTTAQSDTPTGTTTTEAEATLTAGTTSASETTTEPDTTTTTERTTVTEPTPEIEPFTGKESITVSEFTTETITTTVTETTTTTGTETTVITETTPVTESTIVSETSTLPETTIVSETSTLPETTIVSETSTLPETATEIVTTTAAEATTLTAETTRMRVLTSRVPITETATVA